jgi:hypothetical protein
VFLTDRGWRLPWIFSAARCRQPLEQTAESGVLQADQSKIGSGIRSEEEPTGIDRLREGVTTLNMSSEHPRNRAEALFKKEKARPDGNKAMAEYHADQLAMRQKTARLRALRLAREEVNKKHAIPVATERSA